MIEKNSSMRQLIDIRLEKLNRLKELGIEPFPHKYNPTHKSIDIISSFNDLEKQTVCVAGRIMALRKMGKASFIHVMDDNCLLYTSPSPRDRQKSRMPSSA